ncbi:MAG: enoyl-CoA hydratase-related protein [Thermoplasmatales archaeon]|nr:enoyl-CoA hydratase-related protein [Thermoplasmatales archaeon]MCW6170444.1 enoyl-CoA hydratase-related protein [Thermoplasmatales archaeon]
MNNVNVDGFSGISFWRENNLGVIVIKTNKNFNMTRNTIDEIILALTSASLDSEVKAVAFTGQNNYFVNSIEADDSETLNLLESVRTLSLSLASFDKPVFSLLNGPCKNSGYEISLLTDYMISTTNNEVGFNNDYEFIMGGSITSQKYKFSIVGIAKENLNVDAVVARENFLGDSVELINRISSRIMVQTRKSRLRHIREVIDDEHLRYIKNRYSDLLKNREVRQKEVID